STECFAPSLHASTARTTSSRGSAHARAAQMIDRGEILTKAEELDLHPSNVQRDYVFGWLLSGLFREDSAKGPIALKGGNGLRKGYLPSTRFSDDLDFTSSGSLDGEALVDQFN